MTANLSATGATADDLLVLLAVARSGRYTTAARQLGVTHTTIARRLNALERALGGRLLVRGAAGWQLTALGGHAASAGEHVESALAQLDGDGAELRGSIRLSATDGFSAFVAAPAMAALRRRHPGVSLQIVTKTRHASLHRSGVDLEVVVGRPEVRNAKAVQAGRLRARACTHPGISSLSTEPPAPTTSSPVRPWSTSSSRCCRWTRSTTRAVESRR